MVMETLGKMVSEAESGAPEEIGALDDSDSLQPAGVQVNKASEKVAIYCVKTGDRREIPRIYLAGALAKKFKDPREPEWFGKPVFSRTPTKERIQGSTKCMLHPSMPNRSLYDEWGLPVCQADNLASPEQGRMHMEKRHKAEYALIKSAEARTEREEDRRRDAERQDAMLTAIQGRPENGVLSPPQETEEVVRAPVQRRVTKKRKRTNKA